MKIQEIHIRSKSRVEFVDITEVLRSKVKELEVESGICVVYVPHTTAAVTINENADASVMYDIEMQLKKISPESNQYLHGEGNSDAHIKSSLVGSSVSLIIENKDLRLGTWQGIYFCEFDGPRDRKLWLKIISDRK